jgi:hypothetical protein
MFYCNIFLVPDSDMHHQSACISSEVNVYHRTLQDACVHCMLLVFGECSVSEFIQTLLVVSPKTQIFVASALKARVWCSAELLGSSSRPQLAF